MAPLSVAESQICAVLRGASGIARELRDASDEARFLQAAAGHRVRPLLAWRIRELGEKWPPAVVDALEASERAEAAIELLRQREIGRVLRAIGSAGLRVLVFKGAALACTHYHEPWLRPRQDTDLLVAPHDAAETGRVLEAAGYRPAPAVAGQFVSHQRSYIRREASGLRHDIDLHWKPSNPVPLADLLPFDDLFDSAQVVAIGQASEVRVPRPAHALLLSCLHRSSHHADSADLLWLYDIHLQAHRLTDDERAEALDLIGRTGAGASCARALVLARERFNTSVSDDLLAALRTPGRVPLPALYLRSDVSKADLLKADLAAIDGVRGRVRLLKEHLFPPAAYMLRDPRQSRWVLPALYAWRIVRGARGWFRPLGPSAARDRREGRV
jgi:hypothetical protein